MADTRLELILSARDEASRKVQDLENNVRKTQGRLGNMFAGATQASQQFAVALTAAATAMSALAFSGLKTAGELESAEQGFKALLGSAEAAEITMARIKKEAAATPFELQGLVQGTQALAAITKDGDAAIDILLDVGKAVAISGKGQAELNNVIMNLQQVASTGKVMEIDIRQFQRAIPVFNDILAAADLTTDQLKEADNAAELLFGAFKKAGEAGGMTAEGFTAQAGTFNQLMSNLSDTFTIFMSDFVQATGIFDAAKDALSGFIDYISANQSTIIDFARNAIAWLKENGVVLAGVIVGALTPAFIAMAGAVALVTAKLSIFMAIGGLLASKFEEIKAAYDANFGGIKENIENFGKVFEEQVIPAFYNFVATVQQVGQTLMEWATTTAQFIGAKWNEFARSTGLSMEDVQGFFQSFIDFLNGVILPTVQFIAYNIIQAFKAMQPVIDFLLRTIGELFRAAFDVIQGIMDVFTAVFTGDWEKLKTGVLRIVGGLGKALGSAFKFITEGALRIFKLMVDGIVGFFTSLYHVLSQLVSNIGKMIWEAWESVINGILEFAGRVSEELGKIWDAITTGFTDLVGRAWQWGVDLIQGFINGVGSMVENAKNAVGDFANGVVGSVTGIFQFGSPSKLFKQFGEWTIEGFGLGVEGASAFALQKGKVFAETFSEFGEQIVASYETTRDELADVLSTLNSEHASKMADFRSEIEETKRAIGELKTEYANMARSEGEKFGDMFVQQEEKVRSLQAQLSNARVSDNRDDQKIAELQAQLDKEQEVLQQAREFYKQDEAQLKADLMELERVHSMNKKALAEADTIEEQAKAQLRLEQTSRQLEYLRIKEENFATEKKNLLMGVEKARDKVGKSEMELFIENMTTKRVEEAKKYEEELLMLENKLKDQQGAMISEIDMYNRKSKYIIQTQAIVEQEFKASLERQTHITQGETTKQIEMFERLAAAARAAAAAMAGAGVGRYATGGIVGDFSATPRNIGTDTVPAMLTPGEIVLNAAQQRNLASALNGGGGGTNINISIDTMVGSEEFAMEMGDHIVKNLALNTAI